MAAILPVLGGVAVAPLPMLAICPAATMPSLASITSLVWQIPAAIIGAFVLFWWLAFVCAAIEHWRENRRLKRMRGQHDKWFEHNTIE